MSLATARAPQRFGRYILLDRMGEGGMAEVFRAVVSGAEGFRRDLVVKRILEGQASASNFIDMFVHEARISALLHHPNIVQVFDFGQVDGSYFLAMELLRGRDLLRLMRSMRERGRMLSIPIAAHIAHQVALGLAYAHGLKSADGQSLDIVHRDVSPSNIMCLRAGGVKLLDFGIASAIGEGDLNENERSGFKGKLSYMAPESVRGEQQDGRIDLFALGIVLWEMVAGKRLFYGKTDAEKLRAILERPIVAPGSIRADVPAELDRIVMKALERDPDRRYATAQEMAEDLEQVVQDAKFQSRMLPALLAELFGTAPSTAQMMVSTLSPEMLSPTPPASANSSHTRSSLAVPYPSAIASLSGDLSKIRGKDQSSTASARPSGPLPRGLSPAEPAAVVAKEPGTGLASWRRLRPQARLRLAGAGAIVLAVLAALTALGWGVAGERTGRTGDSAAPAVQAPAAAAAARTTGLLADHSNVAPMPADPNAEVAPGTAAKEPNPAPESSVANAAAPSPAIARATANRPSPPHRATAAKPTGGVRSGRVTRGLSIDPFAEAAARKTR